MELGIIRQINIDSEMQASYLDYAMSVIVARALPDVRDGLKPVHRRILYAMHDLGLDPDKPYKKSARIVGEVLGKYHPHGDAAVYEAMVRMAQDFSLRYPLVDGQGNFGSIDGDNAAAMRYTEARLAKIAVEMLADIEKDTVDWTDNFDGTLKEPSVLPALLPNLLVNGASGIAVGMATNIPPHNLGEVCDALCYLIDNFKRHDDVTVEDLMRFIPGPDFPTGGVIYRYTQEGTGDAAEQVDVIAHAYAGGKGQIVMQAKAHIEDMSRNRARIVVTELPYMANKTNLLERIAELVRDGRLEGITDLRDESDRTGMRICIEMTRTVEPRQVLADLYKLTPLQNTFGVSLLALVDGEPRLLSLKRLLLHYIEHRQEVILRRARHDLAKAKLRAHILEGLLRALDVLDEVIATIRKSRNADTAKQNLIEQFKFTEIQAQAILDMQLRRLAALERRKLQEEYRDTIGLIRELEALLASPARVLALIKENLVDLKARYGDARRTQIADRVKGTLTTMDVLPDEEVWVTLAADGALARWRRGADELAGKGAAPHFRAPAPLLVSANTRHDLYLFSAKGQAARIHVHQIPEAPGAHYADLSGLTRRDRVAAMLSYPRDESEQLASAFLLLATSQGKVKRVSLADLFDAAQADPAVIGLDDGDELCWAGTSAGGGEVILATVTGQAIRFPEEDVRAMGLPAGGIGGIKLAAKDRVAGAGWIGPASAGQVPVGHATHLAIVTQAGYGKRVPLGDFPAQGRNGQGVVAARLSDRTGDIVGAVLVAPGDLIICAYAKAASKLIPASDLPEMGRPALGKAFASLMVGEPVRAICAAAGSGGDGRSPGHGKGESQVEAKAKAEGGVEGKRGTGQQASEKQATGAKKADVAEKAAPKTPAKASVAAVAGALKREAGPTAAPHAAPTARPKAGPKGATEESAAAQARATRPPAGKQAAAPAAAPKKLTSASVSAQEPSAASAAKTVGAKPKPAAASQAAPASRANAGADTKPATDAKPAAPARRQSTGNAPKPAAGPGPSGPAAAKGGPAAAKPPASPQLALLPEAAAADPPTQPAPAASKAKPAASRAKPAASKTKPAASAPAGKSRKTG
jgi:DNA gyrase subunit A